LLFSFGCFNHTLSLFDLGGQWGGSTLAGVGVYLGDVMLWWSLVRVRGCDDAP